MGTRSVGPPRRPYGVMNRTHIPYDYVHHFDVTRSLQTPDQVWMRQLNAWKAIVVSPNHAAADYTKFDIDESWRLQLETKAIDFAAKMVTKLANNPQGGGDWFYYLWGVCDYIWEQEQAFTPRPPGSTWRQALMRTTHRLRPLFFKHFTNLIGLHFYNTLFRTVT